MRPTVGPGGVDKDEWRTLGRWLHLDCNPCTGLASIGGFANDGSLIDFSTTLIIQGLLTLTDARVEDGGFHCVPGSHKFSQKWAEAHQSCATRQSMKVPESDELHRHVQKVPIRRGCLLVWTSLLFHGNHPNRSDRFRAVQYIRQISPGLTPYGPLVADIEEYPPEARVAMTDLGKKLFGIVPWQLHSSENHGPARPIQTIRNDYSQRGRTK